MFLETAIERETEMFIIHFSFQIIGVNIRFKTFTVASKMLVVRMHKTEKYAFLN